MDPNKYKVPMESETAEAEDIGTDEELELGFQRKLKSS